MNKKKLDRLWRKGWKRGASIGVNSSQIAVFSAVTGSFPGLPSLGPEERARFLGQQAGLRSALRELRRREERC